MAGLLNGQNLDDLTLKYVIDQELKNAGGGGGSQADIDAIKAEIGNTSLPTTAQTLTGAIAELDGNIDGKVSKSGDTMTGALTVKNNNGVYVKSSLTDGTPPQSNTQIGGIQFLDKNGTPVGKLINLWNTDGSIGVQLRAETGGDYCQFGIGFNSDTTRYVTLSSTLVNPFLSALGLGSVTTTSTISNIISAESGVTISSASVSIWGKVAQIVVTWEKSTAISSATYIATVKSGYRPVAATVMGGSSRNMAVGRLGTDGRIWINPTSTAMSANSSVTIWGTYILA